jgi:hypothetical protein
MKCCYHIFVSQLGYKHLHPVTPPASTLGETSPAPQVLLKGLVFSVLLVLFLALKPGYAPMPTTFLSLLRGIAFKFFQIDNEMTLEDAPESTNQLWRFLLKTSNVKRNSGTKGFPFLSSEQALTVGLFLRSVGVIFPPWLVLVVGFYIDFNACKKNSFC